MWLLRNSEARRTAKLSSAPPQSGVASASLPNSGARAATLARNTRRMCASVGAKPKSSVKATRKVPSRASGGGA